jgi:hypothetical protein
MNSADTLMPAFLAPGTSTHTAEFMASLRLEFRFQEGRRSDATLPLEIDALIGKDGSIGRPMEPASEVRYLTESLIRLLKSRILVATPLEKERLWILCEGLVLRQLGQARGTAFRALRR